MVAIGGRQGWKRARSLAAQSALVALGCALGCGGRTSALDSSAYDGSVDITETSGSGGGGKASAGSGGRAGGGGVASRGGNASAGKAAGGAGGKVTGGSGGVAGGSAGTGGVGMSDVAKVCQDHCSSYGFTCSEDVPNCINTCQNELWSLAFDCQQTALDTLSCIDSQFMSKGVTCASGTSFALDRCNSAIQLLEACKGAPIVTPVPRATPLPDVTNCAGVVSGNAVACKAQFSCDDGEYGVYCAFGSDTGVASCSCTGPSVYREGLFMDDGKSCYQAARALCQ